MGALKHQPTPQLINHRHGKYGWHDHPVFIDGDDHWEWHRLQDQQEKHYTLEVP